MSRSYEKRLARVVAHIHSAPIEELTLDHLAEVAALSRFHFHRVYHAMMGETCVQAVRRIRLHLAASQLVHTERPMDEIGQDAGYSTMPAFSRAFRTAYGMPPGQFRTQTPSVARDVPALQRREIGATNMYEVAIETLPDRRLVGLYHTGDYNKISKAFEQVAMLCGTRNLWPQVQGMAGVYWDNPDVTAEAELRSMAGVFLSEEANVEAPFEVLPVPGGRSAVLRLKGPYAGLRNAYQYLYGDWLAQAGVELRDQPSYEVYLNSPSDTAPEDLLTDICVPLT